MKKLYLILSVALAVVAAASCQKESLVNDDNANVPSSPELHTFTATIAAPEGDTKADIADDGIFTFTAGDFIYIFNGNGVSGEDSSDSQAITFPIAKFNWGANKIQSNGTSWDTGDVVAESIKITDEMISDGGKTLTFSSSVVEPADGGKWYFIMANGGSSWSKFYIRSAKDWTKFVLDNSQVDKKKNILCYASIDKSSFSGSIALKHYDSQFRFKVSNNTDYDKVTITPNSGDITDANCIVGNYQVYAGRTPAKFEMLTNGKKDAVVTLSENADEVYYVSTVSERTWTGGITFHLWKDGVEKTQLTINKDISISAGQIIDFGDLAKVRPDYTSLYEKYQAGYDINVGGVIVNKEKYPDAKLLVDGTVLSGSDNKGVYFVSADATISTAGTWGSLFAGGDVIIIGDSNNGKRSTLNITGSYPLSNIPSGEYGVAFKNISIESVSPQPLFNTAGEGKVSWLVLDNCKLVTAGNGMFVFNNYPRNIGKVILKDSEFRIIKDNAYLLTSSSLAVDEVTVDNCIFYSNTSETAYKACLIDCTPAALTITNNTFVNVYSDYSSALFKIPSSLSIQPTVKNNLRYYTLSSVFTTGQYHSILMYNGDTNIANCEKGAVYVPEVNAGIHHAVVRGSWDSRVTQTAGTPFTTADFTNGVFTNTTTYGAKR